MRDAETTRSAGQTPWMGPSSSWFFKISLIALKVSGMKKCVKISKKRTFLAVSGNLVVSEGPERAKNAQFYIVFTWPHSELHISAENWNSNAIFETVTHEGLTFRMKQTFWESDENCGREGDCTGFFAAGGTIPSKSHPVWVGYWLALFV